MVSSQLNRVLHKLRRAALQCDDGMTDRQLLERFLAVREEAAFEALVRRHGPMVLGVCRRVLEHLHDAEDAFQATFLVLVRKASTIVLRETVGNWLYGVAYRTAQKARATAARRRAKEKHMARPEALEEEAWRELRPLLDQELSRLPDKYREPIVLCDLEGSTRKEAAQRLGWAEGTLSGRLARARRLLARRLARHGLTLSAGSLAGALSCNAATAGLPAPLVSCTVRAATSAAAGNAAAGAIPAPVAALTQGVLRAMFLTKLKTVSALLLTVGLVGLGLGICLTDTAPAPAAQEPPAAGAAAAAPASLPTGPVPVQVLASMQDGKLVVKTAVISTRAIGVGVGGGPGGPAVLPPIPAGGNAPPGGAVPAPPKMELVTTLRMHTYDLDDVQVLDTRGHKLDKKRLANLLKEEAVAMAVWGHEVDPLHLRVLKEGTLTFVLPAPKGFGPGMPGGGGIAPPQPAVPLPPAGGGQGVPGLPGPVPVQPGGPGQALPGVPGGGGTVPQPGFAPAGGGPSPPGGVAPGGKTEPQSAPSTPGGAG
jgi:RNA polymerase sigma factor (sigma-70 family)